MPRFAQSFIKGLASVRLPIHTSVEDIGLPNIVRSISRGFTGGFALLDDDYAESSKSAKWLRRIREQIRVVVLEVPRFIIRYIFILRMNPYEQAYQGFDLTWEHTAALVEAVSAGLLRGLSSIPWTVFVSNDQSYEAEMRQYVAT